MLVLARAADAAGGPSARAAALAGLLGGVGVGLKLTTAPFLLALLATAAVFAAWQRRPALAAAAFSGAAAGLALVAGYWSARLFALHGNPLFP